MYNVYMVYFIQKTYLKQDGQEGTSAVVTIFFSKNVTKIGPYQVFFIARSFYSGCIRTAQLLKIKISCKISKGFEQ